MLNDQLSFYDKIFEGNDFFNAVKRKLCHINIDENYCLICINIEHIRLFSKLYGIPAKEDLISYIKHLLSETAIKYNGIAGFIEYTNFVILIPDNNIIINDLYECIDNEINLYGSSIAFPPIFGVYEIIDSSLDIEIMYDCAVTALEESTKLRNKHIFKYSSNIDNRFIHEVKLLNDIQKAIENREFTIYIQPQCNLSNHKIVGGEALARWVKDGKVIAPSIFIPVMEQSGMIDVLDKYIWEMVCVEIRDWLNEGYHPVPISINISRLDILSIDVPKYISGLIEKYNIPKHYLKMEITESAYTQEDKRIYNTIVALRNMGFKVMMDDFGCGYSSLNMLKSIPVDILKLDMRFLDITEEVTSKGFNILESVVNMARLLCLPIIVEGVETRAQERYILELGIRYTQGYLYFRPIPTDEFKNILIDNSYLDHGELLYKQVEPLHLREFIDNSFISDNMLNNIMGPVAFYEINNNHIYITRVNEQYLNLIGNNGQYNTYGDRFWNNVRDDDRALFHLLFKNAYDNPLGEDNGIIHIVKMDGTCILVDIHVFYLREQNGKKQYYASISDVSNLKLEKNIDNYVDTRNYDIKLNNDVKCAYDILPEALFIQYVYPKKNGKAYDFDIVYINHAVSSLLYGNAIQIKELALDAFSKRKQEILDTMYDSAYNNVTNVIVIYSDISNRYFEFTFFNHSKGYCCTILKDVTNIYINNNVLDSISVFYREIYFLQLQNNYYRMLYPVDNSKEERGNYGDAINRHFYNSKISYNNKANIRDFLAPDNLIKALANKDKVEMPYKRKYKEQEEWCLTSISVCDRDEDGNVKNALMVIRSIDTTVKRSESNRNIYLSDTLENLINPFFIYKDNDSKDLLYANEAVIKLFGCTSLEDFKTYVNNSFIGMVYPDDYLRIDNDINNHIDQSIRNLDFIRYRIKTKNGDIRWIDDIGHLDNSGEGIYYVFLTDITDEISTSQINRILYLNKYYK